MRNRILHTGCETKKAAVKTVFTFENAGYPFKRTICLFFFTFIAQSSGIDFFT